MIDLRKITDILLITLLLCVSSLAGAQNKHKIFIEKYKKHRNSNLDSAKYYAFQSSHVAKTDKEKAYSCFYMGFISKQQHLFADAAMYYRKAYNLFKVKSRVLTAKSNLANVLRKIGKTQEAFELIKHVQVEREKTGHKKLHQVYGVVANVFHTLGQFDSSRMYRQKSINLKRGINEKLLPNAYNSFADLHESLYKEKGQMVYLDSAITLHRKILAIQRRGGKDGFYVANSLSKLSKYYHLKGYDKEALTYADSSLAIDHKHAKIRVDATTRKAEALEALGLNKAAHGLYGKASVMAGQKVESDLVLTKKVVQVGNKIVEKSISMQRTIAIIGGGIVFLFGVMFLYGINLTRNRRKEDHLKIKEGEEKATETRKALEQKEEHNLDMAIQVTQLQTQTQRLKRDYDRERSQKQVDFFGKLLVAEFDARFALDIQRMLDQKKSPEDIQKKVNTKTKSFARLNAAFNAFMQMRPYFLANLSKYLEEKDIKFSKRQQVLCMLLAAKDLGVDNATIQATMGYTSHGGVKLLRKRTAESFKMTVVEFDDFLIELSKKNPHKTVQIARKNS